jgi:hypothetical protein
VKLLTSQAGLDLCEDDLVFRLSLTLYTNLQANNSYLRNIDYQKFKKAKENMLNPSKRKVSAVQIADILTKRAARRTGELTESEEEEEESEESEEEEASIDTGATAAPRRPPACTRHH